MAVTLTERAAQEVSKILDDQKFDKATTLLRVGVAGGGCSGFSYALGFDEARTSIRPRTRSTNTTA